MKKTMFIMIVLLAVAINTSVSAWTINDTIIRSVGLGSQFTITYPITLENLTISSDSIYFANLNSSNTVSVGNYTITFNFTETNINYSGSDLPYVIQEGLEARIYSGLEADTPILFKIDLNNSEFGVIYTSASNAFNKNISKVPVSGNYKVMNITIQQGINYVRVEVIDAPVVNYMTPAAAENNLISSKIIIRVNVTGNFQNTTTVNLYNITRELINSTVLTYQGSGNHIYDINFTVNNATVHKFYVNASVENQINNISVPNIGGTSLLTYREATSPVITFNMTTDDDSNYPLNITATMKCTHKWEPFINYSFALNDNFQFVLKYNQSNGTIITNTTTINNSLNFLEGLCWTEYGSTFSAQDYGLINIEFRHETTNTLITDTNMTLQIIGTDTNISEIHALISTGNISVFLAESGNYDFRYHGGDYGERFRYLEYNQSQTYNLTLYVNNNVTTTQVKVTILDQSGDFVENALIKLYRYDIGTNSYVLVEEGKTNFEGETRLDIELGTEFYKFLVYLDDVLKKETTPSYIYETSLNIYIDTSVGGGEIFEKTENIYHNLVFQEDTGTFKVTYDDPSDSLTSACLDVYTTIGRTRTLFNQSCTTSTSAILYAAVTNVTGRSYLAQFTVTVSGQETVITEVWYSYEAEKGKDVFGRTGLLVLLLLTLTVIGFGASFRASVAVWLAPLPLLILSFANIVTINIGVAIGLEVIAIIIAALMEARRYG